MKDSLILLLLKVIGHLPLSVGRGLGATIGWLSWLSGGRSVRVTRENLRLCWPALDHRQRERLVRQSLLETAKTAAEAAAVWSRSSAWLAKRILEVEGEEHLLAAVNQERGLLVSAPHLGNWEVVGPFLANYAPLTALYQPPRQPALEALIVKGRRKGNIDLAPTTRRGVSQLLKALKRGETVGILPDQVPEKGNGAAVAPFFGHPALTMTLFHSLVQRTNCSVLSIFAQRVPGGFKLVILPVDSEIYSEVEGEAVAALNRSVEQCVSYAPAQYQWEYKRFRRLPAPYPPRYQ